MDADPTETEAMDTESTTPTATTPPGTDHIGTAHTDPGADHTGTAHDPIGTARPSGPEQRLHRAGRGRMLGGVALGLADYFEVDPTLVRIAFVALLFLGGLAVPLYLAGWLLIPDEDTDLSVAEEFLDRGHERSRAW